VPRKSINLEQNAEKSRLCRQPERAITIINQSSPQFEPTDFYRKHLIRRAAYSLLPYC
jgi:hypothetical protein